jgi:hypothetical protein
VVEAPCDFGLVRSNDLVGQMVGRKGTTFWNSDFELKAGELTRGIPSKDNDDGLSESVSIGRLRRRLPVTAKIFCVLNQVASPPAALTLTEPSAATSTSATCDV